MHHKPIPLYDPASRKRCPVCGEFSYSIGGVHPQCCVRRDDAERVQRLKQAAQAAVAAAPKQDHPPWKKRCPRCQTILHVRRAVCDCGHRFVAALRRAK